MVEIPGNYPREPDNVRHQEPPSPYTPMSMSHRFKRIWMSERSSERMKEAASFTVASYHLHDSKNESLRLKKDPSYKDIRRSRQPRLLREILKTDCDILCFQDVEDWHFWKNEFLHRQYGGYWKKRPKSSIGCCIFCKTSRFVEVHRRFLERDDIAQVILLRDIRNNDQLVLICNIHMATDSGTCHPRELLKRICTVLQDIVETWEEGLRKQKCPPNHAMPPPRAIFCGNLNFNASSPIFDWLKSGALHESLFQQAINPGLRQSPNEKKDYKTDEWTTQIRQKIGHAFSSIRDGGIADDGNRATPSPNLSTDYIWFAQRSLKLIDYLIPPTLVGDDPSHVLLVAKFNAIPMASQMAIPPTHNGMTMPPQRYENVPPNQLAHAPPKIEINNHPNHHHRPVMHQQPIDPRQHKKVKGARPEVQELVSELMRSAYLHNRPTADQLKDRFEALEELQAILKELETSLPHQFPLVLHQFGSTKFNLDSGNSDVDLVIQVEFEAPVDPRMYPQLSPVAILKKLVSLIETDERSERWSVVHKRFGASVPLVKAEVKGQHAKINVVLDISILTEGKTLQAAFKIQNIIREHSSVAHFLFAVKAWSQEHGISDSYAGTINSYGWINVGIWTIRRRYRKDTHDQTFVLKLPPDISPAELWFNFLEQLINCCLDPCNRSLKVSNGSLCENVFTRMWVVLDPVDDNTNIIRTLQHHGMVEIRNALLASRDFFFQSDCLSDATDGMTLGEMFKRCSEYTQKHKDSYPADPSLEPPPHILPQFHSHHIPQQNAPLNSRNPISVPLLIGSSTGPLMHIPVGNRRPQPR